MNIYNPPEAPEALRSCRYCNQEMEKEWPSARDSEYICANPECEHSPYYSVRKSQTRNVTIRFYRHKGMPATSEVVIERNDKAREYKPREAHITKLHHIVHDNRLPLYVDFYLYTEITFQFDYEA